MVPTVSPVLLAAWLGNVSHLFSFSGHAQSSTKSASLLGVFTVQLLLSMCVWFFGLVYSDQPLPKLLRGEQQYNTTVKHKMETHHSFTSLPHCIILIYMTLYMLWFNFILGSTCFELLSILSAIFPEHGSGCKTKENRKWTGFKNYFGPKRNLNYN